MAAEPTRIKLKRSTTAAVVPTTSNLQDGEVAVNVADRKIYVRNGQTIVEVANQRPAVGTVSTEMFATDVTNGPGETFYVAKNGSDVTTLTNGGANGLHPDTPFLTVAKALTTATSGDTINIGAGSYQETFPLTVPDGVTIKGSNLRSTQITPTSGTNDLNAFILNGDVHISDLTVKDFFYNSSNDTGYGFVCASSLDSDRSPYIERVTVLTKGSVTSGSDPYGFAQGNAGRGAKLDGALFAASGLEAAVLFNEVTFIVPNSVGLLITNGVRVEWLNSFIYFAAEGIKGVQGATGRSGSGQTRLKLSGVSGTFSSSEVIYQLEDSFKSGTYSRTGTTVTVTRNAHGLANGDVVYADFISGGATDNYYTIANVATNTFELTDSASGSITGNVTYKKADAYGTITTNDGTYLLINGKGVGEFTTGVPIAKVGVIGADAKLDTAQKKFGTASLELDGTADNLTYPTTTDFGFGTTNWAAECFIRPSSVTGTQYIFDFRTGSATDTAPTVYLSGTALHFGVGNASQATGGTLSTGTWYHVAVARSGGSTKLFLDGTQVGSTYTDTNNYGTTKPVAIGSDYNSGANAFAGHIDEVRISKAAARYTANFTAPTSAFGNDLNTVLLIHFDGTDGATTITDSSGGVKDIRSSGGDSATSILTADYAQFGAELRGISSANIYGTKGAIADGAGVKILLTAHNFGYVGSGADFSNDPSLAVPANDVTETNGGKIFYSATNQNGDFRVGDAFVVDQSTGNVQFQSTSTSQEAANITLSDATGTTKIFPAYIETGNLRLAGNTLSSTSGSVIIDPSGNEDITLNAETIATEQLYLRTDKKVGIQDLNAGAGAFNIASTQQAGWSSYGLFSNKNLAVFNVGISTVTIAAEGDTYAANTYTLTGVSNPTINATVTAVLAATGGVKTITLTNPGSGYTTNPTVSFSGSPTTPATATVTLESYGTIKSVSVDAGGTGYTSPTITFDNPPFVFFAADTDVSSANNTIAFPTGVVFENDDTVVYSNQSFTTNIGLVDGTTYYVVNVNTTANTLQLASSQGGSAIGLTAGTSTEQHALRGTVATGTVQESGGVISGVTITDAGVKYSQSTSATITGGSGSGATITIAVGRKIKEIVASDGGAGYSTAPTVTISGDGTGATATSALGYGVASVTINNAGEGYSITPSINVSGGSPTTPASFTPVFGKKSGIIESVTIDDPGTLYSTAPTLEVLGGAGADANLSVEVLPFEGTISNNGSGYAAGVYNNVPFTGGSGTAATATFTVPGLGGTVTNAGSGYTQGTHTPVSVRNAVGTTYVVTTVSREQLVYSSLAGGTFAASDTITGGTSGASGTVVFAGTNANGENVVRFTTISSGPFQNGETISNGTATATVDSLGTVNVYAIGGSETPVISLASHNTYRFDMSDSSNTGHPFRLQNFGTGQFVVNEDGTPGSTGAFVEVIAKDTAAPSTSTVSYYCTAHGGTMGNYVTVTSGAGSPGVYGDGLTGTVVVNASGNVTGFTLVNQGSGYKINDTFGLPGTSTAGSGTSFEFTINSLNTGISSITNISPNGGPYTTSDVLSVAPTFDGVGSGSGFSYTLSKVGFVNSVTVNDGGYGFSSGDVIKLLSAPTTTGTAFSLTVNATVDDIPIEVQYDGGITSKKWNIDKNGSGTIGVTGSSLILRSVTTDGLTNAGNVETATLAVTTSAQISNLTAGGINSVADATIKLGNGTAALPSLALQNSNSTGLYRAAADDIGLSISGTQRGSISASGFDISTDFVVDQTLTESVPYFKIDATNETVTIGAADKQIQIGNSGNISSIGTDADIDISISPKGTGNLILTGGTDQDFSITDGSAEVFKVDTDSGDTTVSGKLDVAKLRIRQNIVSNNSSAATRSFGEVTGLTVTGTGSGYTDGTYTQTATTSTGSGTGLTVTVTVASGTFSAVTVVDKGQNYKVGEAITITAAGGGTGITITVSDIDGQGVVLKPSAGKDILCDTTGSLVIPSGTTNERPNALDRVTGAIRFNSTQLQFEGFNGNDFVSLGGVRDVDQDTYVLTESSPGADEDTFEFFNTGVNSLSISQTKFTLRSAKTFDVQGTLRIDGVTSGSDPLDIQRGATSVVKIRNEKDFEVSNGTDIGLRLKSLATTGAIASIGTVTSVGNNYGTSQTYTGVASTGEFGGTGATFTVTTNGSGGISGVTIVSGGSGYEVDEVIKIAGNLIGGTAITHDITFPVATLSSTVAPFARMDVVAQDYVTQMDNKPFLSLDSNGAEAGFKVNRGWAAGTSSYLTIFDSTGTFVELDDCRVEGGELASFPTTATIIQFDKTAYKGAKTLITIQSDDNKVHMLEVTTVCASNGTTAHATVTNSITSDNNLMDATIAVVGNNVNISLNKSSAATSSSNFTGRFTTTKVKA